MQHKDVKILIDVIEEMGMLLKPASDKHLLLGLHKELKKAVKNAKIWGER